MSSLSIPENAQLAYNTVLKGDPKVEWVLFSLASAGNEIKVQATGSGLDDLEEEFMDGRIQYAFARVQEPNSDLDKFVQINWCGEGVAERQKGLFNTYSPQLAAFLKASHIVIQARNERDVTPDHIFKRMRESSGSKYTPSSDTPAQAARVPPQAAPKPYVPASFSRPVQNFNKPTPSFTKPAPVIERTPTPPPREPTPPPAPTLAPPAPTPAPQAHQSAKPAEDDRIAAVGTAYEPVKLAAPKKLVNRWGQGAQNNNNAEEEDSKPRAGGFASARSAFLSGGTAAASAPVSAGPTPGKKLTWSERQAEAKRQREAEEQAATDAMSKVSISENKPATRPFGYGATTSAPAFSAPTPPARPATPPPVEEEEEESAPPPPPAPLPPRMPEQKEAEDDEDWDDAPPPPPPPPPMPVEDRAAQEEEEEEAPPPPPPPPPPMPMDEPQAQAPPPPMPSRPKGPAVPAEQQAKAVYDYDATEGNEISFKEDDIIRGIEQTDPDWWTGIDPRTGDKGLFPANYVELISSASHEEEQEEEAAPPPPPPPPAPAAAAASQGKTALAVYDYEATESNEISFAEGDEITQIEETDPDWWTGTHAKTGQVGLFPANYVELS